MSDDRINDRLRRFIESRGMTPQEFAIRMGWTKQYLYKLTSGDSFGLAPVRSLLIEFPDLDARWLILGEGHNAE